MNFRASAATTICGSIILALATDLALACPGRLSVWDLQLGAEASAIPDAFVDYACGTDGGPPSRPLANFTEFHRCKADGDGLHEVYFRYDDEQEYVARALEQARAVAMCDGTRVFGFPAIVSALFDDAGVLRGLRIVTDARGAEPADRSDHWALGAMLKHHFGDEGWTCVANPVGAGVTPVGAFLVNDECRRSTAAAEMTVRREYHHRQGEEFTDDFGKVLPSLFVSRTYFQMLQPSAAR